MSSGFFNIDFSGIFDTFGKTIDAVHTSDKERLELRNGFAKIQAEMLGLVTKVQLALAEVENSAAKNTNPWVSGARPACIWACAAGIFTNYMIIPIGWWIWVSIEQGVQGPPELNIEEMVGLVMTIVTLGGLRSVEKLTGKA